MQLLNRKFAIVRDIKLNSLRYPTANWDGSSTQPITPLHNDIIKADLGVRQHTQT